MYQSTHSILLFDGICNLCNGVVQFIIKRDKKGIFRFASLQSDIGQELLAKYGLPTDAINTIVLIENGQAYTHSSAALKIAPHLSILWIWIKLLWIFPAFIRDWIYNWIAKNRYRWFGKQESCMLPKQEWKGRFLQ